MVRWGILGAAEIARKNWKAIWNSNNGIVVAVASRSEERSRRFIKECQARAQFEVEPRAIGSYEELVTAPFVDAVYIPLPTGIRKRWVLQAAEAGKHVVCEKPCAVSVADLEEMLAACRRNRVQFMDGVMFIHSLRLERIREVLGDKAAIGPLRRITSAFAFSAPEQFFGSNIRVQSQLEPHGCLGDLGWYCIRFTLWLMNWKLPVSVTGRVMSEFKHPNSELAVPTAFSGELFFDGEVSSSFYCSFTSAIEQWVNVSGETGYLRIADFVLPFSGNQLVFETGNPRYEIDVCDFDMKPNIQRFIVEEYSHSHPTAQESRLFRKFAAQVHSGSLNEQWPEMALKTQRVMHACRESAMAGGRPLVL